MSSRNSTGALILFLGHLIAVPFKSGSQLETENASLSQQPAMLQRKVRGRGQLTNSDRLLIVWLFACSRRSSRP